MLQNPIEKLVLKFEVNVLVGELLVNDLEGLELVLNSLLTLSTEEALDNLALIAGDLGVLANTFARIDQIIKNSLMDSSDGVAVRTEAVELVGTTVGLTEDGSLSNENNRATFELLLEFSGETTLNHAEALEESVRNEDNNSLLVTFNLDFLSSGHLESLKRFREILGLLGNFDNFVGNSNFKIVGSNAFRLSNHFHVLRNMSILNQSKSLGQPVQYKDTKLTENVSIRRVNMNCEW